MRDQQTLEKKNRFKLKNTSHNDSTTLEMQRSGEPRFKLIEIKISSIESMLRIIDLDNYGIDNSDLIT